MSDREFFVPEGELVMEVYRAPSSDGSHWVVRHRQDASGEWNATTADKGALLLGLSLSMPIEEA